MSHPYFIPDYDQRRSVPLRRERWGWSSWVGIVAESHERWAIEHSREPHGKVTHNRGEVFRPPRYGLAEDEFQG